MYPMSGRLTDTITKWALNTNIVQTSSVDVSYSIHLETFTFYPLIWGLIDGCLINWDLDRYFHFAYLADCTTGQLSLVMTPWNFDTHLETFETHILSINLRFDWWMFLTIKFFLLIPEYMWRKWNTEAEAPFSQWTCCPLWLIIMIFLLWGFKICWCYDGYCFIIPKI